MEDPLKHIVRKSFENFKDETDLGEWEGINVRLIKKNFFHFNLLQFNVYYALSIAATFLLALGVSGHYAYRSIWQPQPEQMVKQIEQVVAPVMDHDSPSPNKIPSTKPNNKQVPLPVNEHVKAVNLLDSSKKPTTGKGVHASKEVKTLEESEQTTAVQAPLVEVKKMVVLKQDTIIRFDTVMTKPNRWKRK